MKEKTPLLYKLVCFQIPKKSFRPLEYILCDVHLKIWSLLDIEYINRFICLYIFNCYKFIYLVEKNNNLKMRMK